MLTYNTQQERLILPEYGRSVQHMLDFCLTIDDRQERTRCAKSIVKCMINILPDVKGTEDEEMRLWEHLRIMSDFRLDVDFPYPVTTDSATLHSRPEPVSYGNAPMRFKHYGSHIDNAIAAACAMEEGNERDALVECIANQMKKSLTVSTFEEIDDSRIFNDLLNMSEGRINLTDGRLKLHEYKAVAPPTGKKKKKK